MDQPDRPLSATVSDEMDRLEPMIEARAALARVIDELSAPIAFWDREMVNTYANAAYASWFGRTPGRMYGVKLKDLLDEHTLQRNLPALRRALSGLPETYETRLRDVSGAVRHVQVTLTPLIVDRLVTGFSVLFVDLTARVHAEAELRAHREAAAARRERERIEVQLHHVALLELYAAGLALSTAITAVPTEIEPRIGLAISSINHAITEVRATVHSGGDADVGAADGDGHAP